MPKLYKENALAALQKSMPDKNVHALPWLKKVVVTAGIGRLRGNKAVIEEVENTLRTITAQKPAPTKARKAIAGFKVRAGEVVGYQTTLRGNRMWDFVEKLVHIDLPRVRDFRGLKQSSFDAKGNYSIGFSEQTVFPEVSPETVGQLHGLGITLSTTASTPDEGRALLKALGFPLRPQTEKKEQ